MRGVESGPLRAVRVSRHKWPGGLVNLLAADLLERARRAGAGHERRGLGQQPHLCGVCRASPSGSSTSLYEKSLNLKTISQGDFGHFRENNQIILSKVAKLP